MDDGRQRRQRDTGDGRERRVKRAGAGRPEVVRSAGVFTACAARRQPSLLAFQFQLVWLALSQDRFGALKPVPVLLNFHSPVRLVPSSWVP